MEINPEKKEEKSPVSVKKFYLEVKPNVDRIFIFQKVVGSSSKFISEMICADVESAELGSQSRFFNGTIPTQIASEKFLLMLLGSENNTEYNFNRLFSKPISEKTLNKFKEKGIKVMENEIVINVPHEIEYVLINVPKVFQELLKLPKNI